MTKIVPIHKSRKVDQRERSLAYFRKIRGAGAPQDHSSLTEKIHSAKEKIYIAATGGLHSEITEALYVPMAGGVRVYVLLDSFASSKETLLRLDKALIREAPGLRNNFIIIDDGATFFLNPLSGKTNLPMELPEAQSEDLFYWFCHYFWNKAEKEKILDNVSAPRESPFPPFEGERNTVNLANTEIGEWKSAIVPQDDAHRELAKQSQRFFFSKDIRTPVRFTNDRSVLGGLELKSNLSKPIGNLWELHEATLREINRPFVPFAGDWKGVEEISERKEVILPDMRAETIEGMEGTEPQTWPDEPHTLEATYLWKVSPPARPSAAKEAKLYENYRSIRKRFHKDPGSPGPKKRRRSIWRKSNTTGKRTCRVSPKANCTTFSAPKASSKRSSRMCQALRKGSRRTSTRRRKRRTGRREKRKKRAN